MLIPYTKKSLRSLHKRALKISKIGYNRWLGYRNKDVVLTYLDNNKKLPKLDALMSMKQGALVNAFEDIRCARLSKPAKRGPYKNVRYAEKNTTTVEINTKLMFIERHEKFPEFYKFCIVGGENVWIDVSENLFALTILRTPRAAKSNKV